MHLSVSSYLEDAHPTGNNHTRGFASATEPSGAKTLRVEPEK